MDLYRRASYLEEYAAKRVLQMKDDEASGSATCGKEESVKGLEELSNGRLDEETEKVNSVPDPKKTTISNDLNGEEVDVSIDTRQNVKRSIPRRKAGMDLPNDMKLKKRPTNGELIIVTTTYV
uniref:Uncharacterized protein n=1 Tax=Ditylenchus dipsaci TaxID=166011 RepID=A0A915DID3_9BILA